MLTDEEAVIACKNIGYDLTCGACAERFFTGGWWGSEHDESCATIPELKIRNEVTITAVEPAPKADVAVITVEPLGNRGRGPT